MSMNQWNGIGRLTRDGELRYSSSGTAICNFTIAVDRNFKNNQGEKEADYIPVVVYKQLAELCSNYLSKGKQVGISGRINTRNYEKDNRKVYVTEVVADNVQFLTPSNGQGNGQSGNAEQSGTSSGSSNDPFANDSKHIDISDDDLPF